MPVNVSRLFETYGQGKTASVGIQYTTKYGAYTLLLSAHAL